MKERTVSQRNFVGALSGGILGILAFGYLHPIALPVGCFLGVIIGWWYQEIWKSAVREFHRSIKEFHQSIAKSQKLWNLLTILALTPINKLKDLKFNIGPCVEYFHFFLFPVIWVLRRPIACVRWLKAHPMNRAYIMKALAVIMYIALNAVWVVPLVMHWIECTKAANKESIMPLFYILGILIVPMMALISCIVFFEENNKSKTQRFYLDWEYYAACGPFRFFAKDLLDLFKLEISLILFSIAKLSWLVGIGGLFVFFVIAPISLAIGVIKGIYHVSTKSGHWLCFGVTVTITALLAWFAYPYLNDARVLWMVALFAGIVSAIATEATRRSIVWFFDASEKMRAITITPLRKRLAPIGQKFWSITEAADNKFLNVLPATIY